MLTLRRPGGEMYLYKYYAMILLNKQHTYRLELQLATNIQSLVITRSLMSRLYGQGHHHLKTAVNTSLPKTILQRSYPGNYQLFKWRKNLTQNERDRLGLTQHEKAHYNIQDTKTGKVEAIMTSAQNKDGKSPISFDKLSAEKVDGSFTPKKDPQTKQPILDANGNPLPDLKKGGQYMATLQTPRTLSKDTDHLREVAKDKQSYADKHEAAIAANIEKNRKKLHSQLPKKIGGIDEE